MTIKDRGNIKWSSLMLTEHKQKLQELLEEENDLSKPELDEQVLEEMDYLLNQALSRGLYIEVTYFKNKRIKDYAGQIKGYTSLKKSIELIDLKVGLITLYLENILAINL